MTKSTITRERLEKINSWRETYGAGSNVMLPAEEAEELARIALAVMDSKPVAWVMLEDLADKDIVSTPAYPDINDAMEMTHGELEPLYRHAQPAPVVPEIDRKAIADKVYGKCSRIPGATFYNAAEFAIDEMEACRAAMLAAAPQPQNAPQNIPEIIPGWIPVSERMPEAEGHYLVWSNASRIDGYCDHLAIAAYQGREWSNEFNWLVTHWMPLPAAPQEVKGE